MKTTPTIVLLAVTMALCFSCASAPAITEASVSVRMPSDAELKSAYGYNFEVNPYLEPSSIIRGKPDEFIVLRIDLSLPAPAHVDVSARIVAPDGTVVAQPKDPEQMRLYWDMWEGKDVDKTKRFTVLDRSYLPSFSLEARAGKTTYYVVLMGKNPLTRPGRVEASLLVAGMEPCLFSAELPALVGKKK